MKLPSPIQRVADELAELPGIGPRQAIRLAFFLVGENKEHVAGLAASIDNLRNIKTCDRCFFIHQNEPTTTTDTNGSRTESLCDICRNQNRNQRIIMVVEKETDLVSLENTNKFVGRYFIIGEITKTGLLEDWQKARLASLKKWLEKEPADEIIFAFNPTSLGDLQTSLLTKELAPLARKKSRLGRGLPTGGEIEFADDDTLGASLERRS